jgi:hypothetical protein
VHDPFCDLEGVNRYLIADSNRMTGLSPTLSSLVSLRCGKPNAALSICWLAWLIATLWPIAAPPARRLSGDPIQINAVLESAHDAAHRTTRFVVTIMTPCVGGLHPHRPCELYCGTMWFVRDEVALCLVLLTPLFALAPPVALPQDHMVHITTASVALPA